MIDEFPKSLINWICGNNVGNNEDDSLDREREENFDRYETLSQRVEDIVDKDLQSFECTLSDSDQSEEYHWFVR